MPFQLTRIINDLYERDEFIPILIYGPLGVGKSAYAMKVVAEVYGESGKPNWEAVKERVVFHPKDFVKRCLSMNKRDKALIWDDGGLWLHALDFWNPFVKNVGKYLNVARTDLAALVITTPLPTWVITKVRGLPDAINIKIIKGGGPTGPSTMPDHPYIRKQRVAKAYKQWILPDMRKTGVKEIFRDHFSAFLPSDFYFDWYKPLRDRYAAEAKKLMRDSLEKMRDLEKAGYLPEEPPRSEETGES